MRTIGILALLALSFILGAHYGKTVGHKVDQTIKETLR